MSYDSIQDYILPLARIVIDMTAAGTILRCSVILLDSISQDNLRETIKKVKGRIWAGVLTICATEIIYAFRDLYL